MNKFPSKIRVDIVYKIIGLLNRLAKYLESSLWGYATIKDGTWKTPLKEYCKNCEFVSKD